MFKSKIVDAIRHEVACESLYQECLEGYQEPVCNASNESVSTTIGIGLMLFGFFTWIFQKIFDLFSKSSSDKTRADIDKWEMMQGKLNGYTYLKLNLTRRKLAVIAGSEVCVEYKWDSVKILSEFQNKQLRNFFNIGDIYRDVVNVIETLNENNLNARKIEYATDDIRKHLVSNVYPGGIRIDVSEFDLMGKTPFTITVDKPEMSEEVNDSTVDDEKHHVFELKSGFGLSITTKDFTNNLKKTLDDLDKYEKEIKKGVEKLKNKLKEMTEELDEKAKEAKDDPNFDIKEHRENLAMKSKAARENGRDEFIKFLSELGNPEHNPKQYYEFQKQYVLLYRNILNEITTKLIAVSEMKIRKSVEMFCDLLATATPSKARDE